MAHRGPGTDHLAYGREMGVLGGKDNEKYLYHDASLCVQVLNCLVYDSDMEV